MLPGGDHMLPGGDQVKCFGVAGMARKVLWCSRNGKKSVLVGQ